jgi:hypothetical protein
VNARRAAPRRPALEPLEVDSVKVVAIGTVLWGIAFLALVPFWGRLQDSGRAWWLWTCLAGLGLGLLGVEVCRRYKAAELRAKSRAGRPPGGRRARGRARP